MAAFRRLIRGVRLRPALHNLFVEGDEPLAQRKHFTFAVVIFHQADPYADMIPLIEKGP
jgi:hypothetical protein